jgi:aryl-alcohol dehydrogenase-like predicted oxidoreductase
VERRPLGRTGVSVSVLGFGGSEIGFERAEVGAVRRLLDEALDAGLDVIDTAECYADSEALIGEAVAGRRRDYRLFTKCGHYEGSGRDDWRPASLDKSIARSLDRLRSDHVDLLQLHSCSEEELRRGDVVEVLERARERGQARHLGYSGDGPAARYAIECGRFEVANAAWRTGRRAANAYHHAYWDRLQRLDYGFLRRPLPEAIGVALRFTASVPGVHTLIIGTTRPGRWRENAARLAAGPLPAAEYDAIRARWNAVADPSWVGQR